MICPLIFFLVSYTCIACFLLGRALFEIAEEEYVEAALDLALCTWLVVLVGVA